MQHPRADGILGRQQKGRGQNQKRHNRAEDPVAGVNKDQATRDTSERREGKQHLHPPPLPGQVAALGEDSPYESRTQGHRVGDIRGQGR